MDGDAAAEEEAVAMAIDSDEPPPLLRLEDPAEDPAEHPFAVAAKGQAFKAADGQAFDVDED